ncbi:MAG: hypothetical protein ACO263_05305 [Cyclobacteriaceae bacterium]|jgi:uncharacterized lipoprotein YbaY
MKKLIPLVVFAALLSSCTQTLYMGRIPQTHFTFPNSNVEPLNKVTGESNTRIRIFMPPTAPTSTIINEAYTSALMKAPGSDAIINGNAYYVITQVPLMFLNIYIHKMKIDGTAAKQEVGKQILK